MNNQLSASYDFTFMSMEVNIIVTLPAACWPTQLLEGVCEGILRHEGFIGIQDLWRGVGGVLRLMIAICNGRINKDIQLRYCEIADKAAIFAYG